MADTPYFGVVESYCPLAEEELVNILYDFFREVIGTQYTYDIDNSDVQSFVGYVAALPLASEYMCHDVLPAHNPVYGDECRFTPDFVIDTGNNGFFNDNGNFSFDPGYLYYTFTYC